MATTYRIIDRPEAPHGMSIDEFDLREAEAVASEIVIQEPNVAPLLIDGQSRQLIFAELPAGFDLTEPGFAPVSQARAARRLIGVPFGELPELAAAVPRPARHVFIPCTSRSGTTLLHRIFNRVQGFASLAEVSIFAGARMLDEASQMKREELLRLLASCVRLQAWPYADKAVVFKLRASETPSIRLLNAAVPDCGNVMIYRNAVDWAASWWRFHLKWGRPTAFTIDEVRTNYWISGETLEWLATWLDESPHPAVPALVANLAMWIDSVVAHQDAWERGLRPYTLRYEDLIAHRDATLERLFEHLEIAPDQLAAVIGAFSEDSQKGTAMARQDGRPNDVILGSDQIDLIGEVLSAHPRGLSPAMILPGTILH